MNRLSPGMSKPPRILVVDDEEEVREILAETLEEFGYAVTTAGSGEEALRRLDGDGIAMVITDVRMPGMSGLDLAEQVRRRWPAVKVVLISGYFVPPQAPTKFLKKPFHMKDLASLVRAELG